MASDSNNPLSSEPVQPEERSLHAVHFENVKAGDDSLQILVSTTETGVFGKDVIIKDRSTQFLGPIPEHRLQDLSSDRTKVLLKMKEYDTPTNSPRFTERFGAGKVLSEVKIED